MLRLGSPYRCQHYLHWEKRAIVLELEIYIGLLIELIYCLEYLISISSVLNILHFYELYLVVFTVYFLVLF